ncbi:MAG: KpsF/GutQ family sugar-phosphate isomerase [Alistipes sp.]|nr:KpsF/GutQ family sugar-phosphate isomerase [Candidatus Minthomonas equi]
MTDTYSTIFKYANSVVDDEIEAVRNTRGCVNEKLVGIIDRISRCRGRVIVSGVGKCAFVAQKMVASMNSTGTPAIFMHCADAVHGDMGMIQKDDMVIIISKSGNTSEIKRLIPFIRDFGNYLVAMVSNEDSYLARHADDVIFIPVEKEACPNNLAPTCSTTAQMVMGDGIAITLSGSKNSGREDFARFHPGGSLGKRLYMTVGDLLDRTNVPSVSPEDSIPQTILNISTHRLGATVVLDGNGTMCGIITDGDVRRMVEKGGDFNTLQAKDIMSVNPKRIDVGALAVDALEVMEKNEITSVVVLEEGRYVGLVHIHDIMKEGIA